MGSIDGEIPAVWFLISSIGFVILSFIHLNELSFDLYALLVDCVSRIDPVKAIKFD